MGPHSRGHRHVQGLPLALVAGMSIGYAIIPQHSLLLIRGWGVLTIEEVEAMTLALRADPRFRPTLHGVADFREATGMGVSGTDLRTRYQSALAPNARRAVVVASLEVYGLARMYQLASDYDSASFQVFSELPPALAWLGLPSDFEWPSTFPDASFGPD